MRVPKKMNVDNAWKEFGNTKLVSNWLFFQVFIPLSPILAIGLAFWVHEQRPDAYVHLVGRGQLHAFSVLLLLAVRSDVAQAISYTKYLGREIQLDWASGFLLAMAIFVAVYYGAACSFIMQPNLTIATNSAESLHQLCVGAISGTLVALIAILASLVVTLRKIKAFK